MDSLSLFPEKPERRTEFQLAMLERFAPCADRVPQLAAEAKADLLGKYKVFKETYAETHISYDLQSFDPRAASQGVFWQYFIDWLEDGLPNPKETAASILSAWKSGRKQWVVQEFRAGCDPIFFRNRVLDRVSFLAAGLLPAALTLGESASSPNVSAPPWNFF